MNTTEYNGWTNYETWLVKLWMDNEQGTSDYWREESERVLRANRDEDKAEWALVDALKEYHEETLPKLEGFAADLMNAAMSEVNWGEIAHSLIEDAKESVES